MNSYPFDKPLLVLMVEDNPDDVELTQEALIEAKMAINFDVVEDGAQALAYLRQQEPYANASLPDLILLDLNLPKISGQEVLEQVKADDRLKRIPVIILTTSQAEQDVASAYHHHANAYISKPVDLDQFIKMVRSIENFWLTIVKLPRT